MNLACSQICPLACLVLYLIGFVLPLVVLKRRGIDVKGTMEGVTGWTPFAKVMTLVSMLWVPMVILYAIDAESIVWFLRVSFLDNGSAKVTGVAMAGTGLAVLLLGMAGLGANFRVVLPRRKTELVTNGVYHYVRNPLVLSLHMLVLGMFLMIPNLLMLAAFICSIFQYEAKIREEERFLLQMHGEAYKKYKKDTGKYLPIMRS